MRLVPYAAGLLLLAGLASCQSNEVPDDYAVRVGDSYLTNQEIDDRLSNYSALRDTASARRHIIDSWTTEQLLYREARRRNMADRPDVQAQLRETRRSVLVNALIEDLKKDVSPPSETSIQTYYQQHRTQLRLREPFLRVRYVTTADQAEAARLRTALTAAPDSSAVDSIWQDALERLARDPDRVRRLSNNYLPVSRLQRELSPTDVNVSEMAVGSITPVIESSGTYHLLQIISRLDEGTLPPLDQVRDKILQQLIIQEKKLMYTREVQRLRTRAQANNSIEVRD